MQFQPILPPKRREAMRIAGLWNDRVLASYFDETIARFPDKTAVVDFNSMACRESRLTYAELESRVSRMTVGLAALGVGPQDVVSCQLPNWWELVALTLACARIGAVINPLMPIFRHRELGFMLGFAESRLFIVPRSFRGFDHPAMATELKAGLPLLERILVVGGEGRDSFEEVLLRERAKPASLTYPGGDDVAQLLFTSGTTGEPKGAMHSWNTLTSIILPYIERLRLSSSDIVFMASPLAHQTGFMYGLMLPIMLGATTVLQDIWEPVRAARSIAAERVTYTFASTPFLADLTEVAESGGQDFSSLRVFHSAGAPIPRVLVGRASKALGAKIISGWGMTENGAVTTAKLDDPPEKIFHTDGTPLPGMEIRVTDADNRPLPPGEEGRFQVRGCGNFLGYLKRPQLFATDEEGWFDTGDLARIDADNYVRITGRSKDIVIRGGENVPVVEIEEIIYRHPSVQAVAIVGMPDARLGERACAFVVLKPGMTLRFDAMIAFLSEHRIAKNYLPERLEILDEMPRTPSGKIQKFKLREIASIFAPGAGSA